MKEIRLGAGVRNFLCSSDSPIPLEGNGQLSQSFSYDNLLEIPPSILHYCLYQENVLILQPLYVKVFQKCFIKYQQFVKLVRQIFICNFFSGLHGNGC